MFLALGAVAGAAAVGAAVGAVKRRVDHRREREDARRARKDQIVEDEIPRRELDFRVNTDAFARNLARLRRGDERSAGDVLARLQAEVCAAPGAPKQPAEQLGRVVEYAREQADMLDRQEGVPGADAPADSTAIRRPPDDRHDTVPFQARACVVCLDELATDGFSTCCHIAYCGDCYNRVAGADDPRCALCRASTAHSHSISLRLGNRRAEQSSDTLQIGRA